MNRTPKQPVLPALTKPPVTRGEFKHAYLLMMHDVNHQLDPFAGQGRGRQGYQAWFTKAFPAATPFETAALADELLTAMCT